MEFSELTEEQKAKARECTSAEQLVALAREEGVELTDEQLDAVSGGGDWYCGADCSENTNSCPTW